jgi:hypothetical protein
MQVEVEAVSYTAKIECFTMAEKAKTVEPVPA